MKQITEHAEQGSDDVFSLEEESCPVLGVCMMTLRANQPLHDHPAMPSLRFNAQRPDVSFNSREALTNNSACGTGTCISGLERLVVICATQVVRALEYQRNI